MRHLNIEIKARCAEPEKIRGILRERGARMAGTDHQIDTYFRVPSGRLKLREGNIENALIFYQRADQKGPKRSDIVMAPTAPESGLKEVLSRALGIKVVVDKRREIYFIGNVKFHIDQVEGLGSFVEIEAIGTAANRDELLRQCREYLELLGIGEQDLVERSYSDMLSPDC
jgi:predicted adenylyl cyclase CyaB